MGRRRTCAAFATLYAYANTHARAHVLYYVYGTRMYIYIYVHVTLRDKRNTVVDFTVLHFQFADPL